jgi:acyl-CoA synthetase (AMP-forming)/AMP-acid ligase II
MIFRSPYPDVTLPEMPLAQFTLQHAPQHGDKPALIDGETGYTLTYAELYRQVQNAAAGLIERGLQKGDVVALISPNRPEYAVAFHAVMWAGGVITPLNPTYTADEMRKQMQDSGTTLTITTAELAPTILGTITATDVREVFTFGEAVGTTPFQTLTETDKASPDVTFDLQQDLTALPYSSGTTGFPKGVMLTHHSTVANMAQMAAVEDTDENDVIIAVLPFYHIYGIALIMNLTLYKGGTIVTMPRFDMTRFLQLMQDYDVTRAYLVPPIILGLANYPDLDQYDLSTLESIASGAAPMSESVAKRCMERLNCSIRNGFGLTEASPRVAVNPEDTTKIKIESVGLLDPNTECKIVDLDGASLGIGEEGEICIRGPQLMKGYLNQPDATASTIIDGWLHTGDIGYIDTDGYLFVVDRVKELIKYKGYSVAPAELEDTILSHPDVVDAAVIGAPDEAAGEIPKAYIVLRDGTSLDEQTLMEYIAERVAPYKKIRQVTFTTQIPKSASGKILRRVLIERERAAGQ